MSSSDLVVTTSLNYQCHGVGSSATRNNGIERRLCPIDRIYVCNRLAIFTCIIHLDCFDSSIHLRQCTLCQYRSSRNRGQCSVGHHLRSDDRSNNIGIDRIQCRTYLYGITPCLGRRNQRRDNMFFLCNRIHITRTVANILCDGIMINFSNRCWNYGQMQLFDCITTILIRKFLFIDSCCIIWLVVY